MNNFTGYLSLLLGILLWRWLITPTIKSYIKTYSVKPVILIGGLPYFLLLTSLLAINAATQSSWIAVGNALILVVCLGIVRCDMILHLIPDRFQILGAVGSGILVWQTQTYQSAVVGLLFVVLIAIFGWVYEKLRGKVGMGLGDVKLLAWLSLLVGTNIVNLLLLACVFGIAWTLGKRVFYKKAWTEPFAFGPCIIAGFALQNII